ncbi:adenosine deaminase [Phyllobacterium zundukense]|jgi:adenosine deaminase|uniref:Adenosine deaminase n=1 Tax=Phyllobacterium zundukense TaxID=1867719 RepID=A0ACD4D7E9_9HYPH|nr:adenosine deaminase [Phyllobacterium zundukense]UXN61623.1 adenosine deaminase [Phyllobacterium zundukense]
MVLKAELHCHIEGAASPRLVERKATKYGADVSAFIQNGRFVWHDFTSFLRAFDQASMLFRTAEDYADLAEDYLLSLSRQDAIYSEFFISTDHAISAGLDPRAYIDGLAEGIQRAKAATGIETRMIATGLRHKGPEAVTAAAQYVAANPHPLITGFGMAGDERMHPPSDFAAAFDIARDAGLGITVHAGELVGWESVANALDTLKPARIGHGVRAIENADLVKRLADEQIVLECCPGSNISLGVYPDFLSHPFAALAEAGVPVTLNADDPPYFHTDLAREYEIAATYFGHDDVKLTEVTGTALKAAFVDEDTRTALLERLYPDKTVRATDEVFAGSVSSS